MLIIFSHWETSVGSTLNSCYMELLQRGCSNIIISVLRIYHLLRMIFHCVGVAKWVNCIVGNHLQYSIPKSLFLRAVYSRSLTAVRVIGIIRLLGFNLKLSHLLKFAFSSCSNLSFLLAKFWFLGQLKPSSEKSPAKNTDALVHKDPESSVF